MEEQGDDEDESIAKLWISMSKYAKQLYDNPKAMLLHQILDQYWDNQTVEVAEALLKFLLVLVSQNDTRKYVKYLITDKIFIHRLKRTKIYTEHKHIQSLIESLSSYSFQSEEGAYTKLTLFKKLAYKHFPEQLAKSSINQQNEVGSLCSITYLENAMKNTDYAIISSISKYLRINPEVVEKAFDDENSQKEVLIDLIKEKVNYKNTISNGYSVEHTTYTKP